MKNKMRPYQHWNRMELRDTLKNHVERLCIQNEFKQHWIKLIDDAFHSMEWDVLMDFNGCSIIQDHLHPDPACFIHDFCMISGRGGIVSDRIFFHCMIAEGMTCSKAWRRWLAVRVGWLFFFKWKYIKKRNLKPITKTMMDFYKYLQNEFS